MVFDKDFSIKTNHKSFIRKIISSLTLYKVSKVDVAALDHNFPLSFSLLEQIYTLFHKEFLSQFDGWKDT